MMNAFARTVVAAALLSGCGNNDNGGPDAGVQDDCGAQVLDCAAQNRYGLIVDRCFEYEQAGAAGVLALGAFVKRVYDVENGLNVIEVEYNQGGLVRMKDAFFFEGQDLLLARREWPGGGGAVTYRDDTTKIVGVPIWRVGTNDNETFSRIVKSDVQGRPLETTTFRVTAETDVFPTENPVPAGDFPTSTALIIQETQTQRFDSRRVFVDGTGFTVLSSTLSSQGGTGGTQFRLMKIRDVGTADGGTYACGFTQ